MGKTLDLILLRGKGRDEARHDLIAAELEARVCERNLADTETSTAGASLLAISHLIIKTYMTVKNTTSESILPKFPIFNLKIQILSITCSNELFACEGPLSRCRLARLIVILQKKNKSGRRQIGTSTWNHELLIHPHPVAAARGLLASGTQMIGATLKFTSP